MKRMVVMSILIVFCFTTGFVWFVWNNFVNSPMSSTSEEVVFEVKPGQSFVTVVRELQAQEMIRNGQLFSLFAKIKGQASRIKVGEYALNRNMRPNDVLNVITSGKSIPHPFTVPEGFNMFEISEMYQEKGFGTQKEIMDLVRDPEFIQELTGEKYESLEGFLFPETYNLTKYTTAKELVTSMVRKFQSVWKEIEPIAKQKGWSKLQTVTLGSIVEKETGVPEERPIISSVFHNRMQKNMRLQTDPTVLYGKALGLGKMIISITRADLTTPTRYNTYTIPGLPPGPIANPGKEAMLAALQPASSEFLYFVSRNNGTHIFSRDYKGHVDAVRKFQMDPRAREGKSWRDRLKKDAG